MYLYNGVTLYYASVVSGKEESGRVDTDTPASARQHPPSNAAAHFQEIQI